VDIQVTDSPEAFDSESWRKLHLASPNRNIFSTPEWHRVWWDEFGEGKELFVLTFVDPDPVAMAALMLDQTDEGGRIRFVGGDDLTDYLGPIWADDRDLPSVADALVAYLKEEIGGWGFLDAKCMPVPFGFAEWLVEAADRRGLGFSLHQDEVSAVLSLPTNFEEYLANLSQKKRHELKRKLRRFEREVESSALTSASEDTLGADVLNFIDLHRGSHGLKGKFMESGRATFFARIAQTFNPEGMLSLDFLEVDGRRIAAMFSFPFEDTFYLYNSAYEEDTRHLSPGLVLAAKLIQRCIEKGFARMDFLRGRERYKFDLGAEPVPLHTIRLTNRR
jgi:CelD/BcsL family acetyltransferase involved in cellulose biosynthesis